MLLLVLFARILVAAQVTPVVPVTGLKIYASDTEVRICFCKLKSEYQCFSFSIRFLAQMFYAFKWGPCVLARERTANKRTKLNHNLIQFSLYSTKPQQK